MGFDEYYNLVLTTKDFYDAFGLDYYIEIKSSKSGVNTMRSYLFPELLKALNYNKKELYPQKLFEIGEVVKKGNTDTGYKNYYKLALVISDEHLNFDEIRSIIFYLMDLLGFEFKKDFYFDYVDNNFLKLGKSGKIILNNKEIGFFGFLNNKAKSFFNLKKDVLLLELDLDFYLE